MPNPSSTCLNFYPSYCYPLSPTYNTWARLTASDVHALRERAGDNGALITEIGQNLYFHLNHPIRWIRLVGVIIAVDVFPNRWVMLLDDSSGATIELTCRRENPSVPTNRVAALPENGMDARAVTSKVNQVGLTGSGRTVDLGGIDIGTVVKVKGGIGVFRGEKQVIIERISLIPTTNEEVTAWAEITTFHHEILNIPWVISHKEQERAKRKAANEEHEKKLQRELRRRKRTEIVSALALKKPRDKEGNSRSRHKDERIRERSRRDAEKKASTEKKQQDRPIAHGTFDALGL